MAERDSTQRNRKPAAQRPSLTRHPLFPAIVGLWFAALLGTGSLVLSTALFERIVLAAHIDSVIPAAAPPLGMTARLLLALGFGLVGGAIGWVLAWRLAHRARPRKPQVFHVADVDVDRPFAAPSTPVAPIAPEPVLDPASLIVEPEAEAPQPELAIKAEPEPEILTACEPEPEPELAVDVIPAPAPAPTPAPTPAPARQTAADRIAGADLSQLSHVELIERLAIALQRREALRADSPDDAGPAIRFPDFVARESVRQAEPAPPVVAALAVQVSPPARLHPAAPSQPAPQETEKALRAALAQLQRMSGTGG